jgi:hypothetical protein
MKDRFQNEPNTLGTQRYGSDYTDNELHQDIWDHNAYPGTEKIENPGDVDEGKWKKAKDLAEKEYGAGHWAAVSYLYKKLGGTFHRKS